MLVMVPTRLEAALVFPEIRLPEALVTAPWKGAPGSEIVHVAACGFGMVAAAAGATRLLLGGENREIACLLGLAGTLRPDEAPVGTVVVATAVSCDDAGLPRGARTFEALAEELSQQEPAGPFVPEAPALRARVLTVGVPSAGARQATSRAHAHPECVAEDMESHAVLHAARVADRRVAILRGISNVAGDRRTGTWRTKEAAAALRRVLVAWIESR